MHEIYHDIGVHVNYLRRDTFGGVRADSITVRAADVLYGAVLSFVTW